MQDEAGAPLIAAHDETTPPEQSTAQRSRLFAVLGTTAALVLVLDQLTKLWALRALTPGDPIDVVGSLIRLNLIRNPGAAFSIGTGATWVLTLIACGVLVFILVTARRLGSVSWAWALGLLLGGSLGNLADRVFREPGAGRGHGVDVLQQPALGRAQDLPVRRDVVTISETFCSMARRCSCDVNLRVISGVIR